MIWLWCGFTQKPKAKIRVVPTTRWTNVIENTSFVKFRLLIQNKNTMYVYIATDERHHILDKDCHLGTIKVAVESMMYFWDKITVITQKFLLRNKCK